MYTYICDIIICIICKINVHVFFAATNFAKLVNLFFASAKHFQNYNNEIPANYTLSKTVKFKHCDTLLP